MRLCGRCKTEKALGDFYSNRSEKDGLAEWCKTCIADYNRARRVKRLQTGHCFSHNRPLVSGVRCERCEETHREHNLKQNYGITPEQYDAMLSEQGGVCAICKKPPFVRHSKAESEPRVRRLAVDHDHKTGRIRGLLCSKCNHALGHADDRPERLTAMAAYLQPDAEYVGAGC